MLSSPPFVNCFRRARNPGGPQAVSSSLSERNRGNENIKLKGSACNTIFLYEKISIRRDLFEMSFIGDNVPGRVQKEVLYIDRVECIS